MIQVNRYFGWDGLFSHSTFGTTPDFKINPKEELAPFPYGIKLGAPDRR